MKKLIAISMILLLTMILSSNIFAFSLRDRVISMSPEDVDRARSYVEQASDSINIEIEKQDRVQIEVQQTDGVRTVRIKNPGQEKEITINTELNFGENGSEISIITSNQERKELKILPEQALERARNQLETKQINKIELKEQVRNNIPAVVYHIEANKTGRFLGIFKFAMKVETEIDAETGEVIQTSKPWWAFLVREIIDSQNNQELDNNSTESEEDELIDVENNETDSQNNQSEINNSF